jgi:hypothetical protein
MKTILALALSACLGTAVAAPSPIVFGDHTNSDSSGGDGTAFDNVYTALLNLSAPSWVSGELATNDIGADPLTDVQSVVLRQVGGSVVLSWTPGTTVDWAAGGSGAETWSLPAQWLSAGTWELEVTGVSYMDKGLGGYDGSLTVPEPMSLTLTLAALGLLGLSRRQR